MKAHIKQTLEEIEGDITTLTTLRDNLESLYGGDNDVIIITEKGRRARKRRTPTPPQPAGNGEAAVVRPGSEQEKALIAARKLPAPFTAEALAVAMSIDRKAAGNVLFLLKQKSAVKSVGREGLSVLYEVN